MKNINLNPGGVIGAILLMAAVIAAAVMLSDPETLGRRTGRYAIFALLLGAFGGNYLWDRLFRKS